MFRLVLYKSCNDENNQKNRPHDPLGLDDQYSNDDGPNKGWEDNIMANGLSGKVDNRNINDILKDVWQKCDEWLSNGNTGVFRYEINP